MELKPITNQYDYQNYVKPVYCSCCDIMIHSNTIIFHKRSDFHKTAQHLRNTISEPIKDIKQGVPYIEIYDNGERRKLMKH